MHPQVTVSSTTDCALIEIVLFFLVNFFHYAPYRGSALLTVESGSKPKVHPGSLIFQPTACSYRDLLFKQEIFAQSFFWSGTQRESVANRASLGTLFSIFIHLHKNPAHQLLVSLSLDYEGLLIEMIAEVKQYGMVGAGIRIKRSHSMINEAYIQKRLKW